MQRSRFIILTILGIYLAFILMSHRGDDVHAAPSGDPREFDHGLVSTPFSDAGQAKYYVTWSSSAGSGWEHDIYNQVVHFNNGVLVEETTTQAYITTTEAQEPVSAMLDSPAGDTILTAWEDGSGSSVDVRGQLHHPDGMVMRSNWAIAGGSGSQHSVSIAHVGDAFLVAYADEAPPAQFARVRTRLLNDTNGNLLETLDLTPTNEDHWWPITVDDGGDHALIGWGNGTDFQITVVSHAGGNFSFSAPQTIITNMLQYHYQALWLEELSRFVVVAATPTGSEVCLIDATAVLDRCTSFNTPIVREAKMAARWDAKAQAYQLVYPTGTRNVAVLQVKGGATNQLPTISGNSYPPLQNITWPTTGIWSHFVQDMDGTDSWNGEMIALFSMNDPATNDPTYVPVRLNGGDTYYVATTGNDANSGSIANPWETIQHAANTLTAGDTVFVRGGTYAEAVTINVSGSAGGGAITFINYPGETPILDGTTLTVPATEQALFHIDSQNYITIDGFELQNYKTNNPNRLPLGIFVTGDAHHIQLKNNRLHGIENNGGSDGNAHGIAAYGTEAPASINNILVEGNELYDMNLGNSEAMVLNGNVEDFFVINNIVHDVDNIGIDLIGFEGTASAAFDQARDGVVKGNIVYNVDTITNPAYFGERSAAGIYVDGGTRILIERNIVHHSNFGIELASEHAGKATSFITLQNNLIYLNQIAGLAMGGYDTMRGSTENCVVTNNTFYHNDTLSDGNGEMYLQYDIKNSQIENNIFYANSQNVFMTNDYAANTGNTVDYNLYYASDGTANGEWQWKTTYYTGFANYQSGSGNDAHSVFTDPLFVNVATSDFHLQTGSLAIDTAIFPPAPNEDFDGVSRPVGAGYDKGAYEYNSGSTPSYLPFITITAVSPNNVLLEWNNDTQTQNYPVWHATSPYFTPAGAPLATVSTAAWEYTHAAALGDVNTNHYYLIEAHGYDGSTSYSKRVGEFDFGIVAGS